jgi:hypothetical protein
MLKENIIQKLLVFERKILRGIFGPTKENQTWRIKNNEELDKLIKHENIVNYIKAQRLSWFGHIQGMPEARVTKKIFKWNSLNTRPRGRPKYRWKDNIIQDLGQMKINNWLTCVQVREKLRMSLRRPNPPIKGGSAPEEKEKKIRQRHLRSENEKL